MSTEVAVMQSVPADEYRAMPGLSHSAIKDLAISPLRFWYRHINPEHPVDEPTPEMVFGTALHCAVLEPDQFLNRFAEKVTPDQITGCLETIDDIRGWIRDKGQTPKGTRKADVIAQAQSIDSDVPVFEVIERRHFASNHGKTFLDVDTWERVHEAAESLRSEPHMKRLLDSGQSEVSMFTTDAETGVILKARMDWVTPSSTVDLKTFSQKRGKSIDKSIADAIFYEGYYRQAYFYSLVRGWPKNWNGDFVLAFVESDQPHETRMRSIVPKIGGNVNIYWERARIEIRGLLRTYAECMEHFGPDKPWRYAQEVTPLCDEEMPGLAY